MQSPLPAMPPRVPPITDFLLWWVRCDEFLAKTGQPGLDHSTAATLFRAGLDVDEVAARGLSDSAP